MEHGRALDGPLGRIRMVQRAGDEPPGHPEAIWWAIVVHAGGFRGYVLLVHVFGFLLHAGESTVGAVSVDDLPYRYALAHWAVELHPAQLALLPRRPPVSVSSLSSSLLLASLGATNAVLVTGGLGTGAARRARQPGPGPLPPPAPRLDMRERTSSVSGKSSQAPASLVASPMSRKNSGIRWLS